MSEVKIGIILGSTHVGRYSPAVGEWVQQLGESHADAIFGKMIDEVVSWSKALKTVRQS